MRGGDDLRLAAHHAAYAFYYKRASPLEVTFMDAAFHLKICLTIAVNGPRKDLPAKVLTGLERTTNILEAQFMEMVGVIRAGPALGLLTENQRAAIEKGCFSIQFLE